MISPKTLILPFNYLILTGITLFLTAFNLQAQNWNPIFVAGDGVTELGKYVDFHETKNGTEDYSLRFSILGGRFFSSGKAIFPGMGINTESISNGNLHIFGNYPSSTNLILSANYENSYRWKFKTTDRGNAIDLDIVATDTKDAEQPVLQLSPTFSGRPEFLFMNDWLVVNNSNVGIGTTNPTEKLSVNGKILAKEITIVASHVSWPDYVFESSYNLTSLNDIEKYIKANKHLPEIPSAKEVKEKGVNLGEMNVQLLKKLEELTLHLIEKDKQLKTDRAVIETQQKQLNEIIKRLDAIEK